MPHTWLLEWLPVVRHPASIRKEEVATDIRSTMLLKEHGGVQPPEDWCASEPLSGIKLR